MNVTSKISAFVSLGLPLVFACGGDNLTLPSGGAPAHIEVFEGDAQTGAVNSKLSGPLRVRVTDSQGRPIAGATVEFVLEEDGGGGSVAPTNATTDAKGEAGTSITLGTQVGTMRGQARVPVDGGSTSIADDFTAIATSTSANTIAAFSGDGQAAPVGTPLSQPLVVQVTDGFGNAISGVTVQWTAEGGGSVSAPSSVTDASGFASVQRTLGPTAGPQTTLAIVEGLNGSPVIFNHTATAGTAARVVIVSGNNQQAPPGTRLPNPLVVQVLDEQNNPIVGTAVTWVVGTGEGTVDQQNTITDGQGQASTQWTLGPATGRNTLSAVSGVGVVSFTAMASKATSSTNITSHQPEPSTVGQAVEVRVQVTGSGATPTGSVSVTAEGVSTCNITLAEGTGACSLIFGAAGNVRITATYAGDNQYNGSSDSENHRVEAPNSAPTAAFTPPTCTAGQQCQFNDGSSDSDGNVVAWVWDFGDGGSADQKDPTHTYGAPGTYNVKLTVRDNGGLTSEVTHQVTVNSAPVNSPPSASFTHAACVASTQCQFTDTSTDDGSIVAWSWDFGDFSLPVTDQNPTHAYIVGAGFTYQVTLTVTDNQGVSASVTQPVTVQ